MLIYTSTLLHYRGKYYYFYSNSFTWQLKLWVMCHIHILHKTNHMISLWSLDPLSHPRPDNELLMGLITFKLLRHKHNIDISQSSTTRENSSEFLPKRCCVLWHSMFSSWCEMSHFSRNVLWVLKCCSVLRKTNCLRNVFCALWKVVFRAKC